jgi:VanZ family protein
VTTQLLLRIAAWLLLLVLIFVTLSPIQLRPVTPLPVQVERSLALAVIGFVVALAYPRHIFVVALIVLGSTVALEALQALIPGRHGRVLDLAVKSVGGAVGVFLGWALTRPRRRRKN